MKGATCHFCGHKVKRALEQEIDGSEPETDLQARVDDLLTKHLEPIQRKRREQARQALIGPRMPGGS